MDATSPFRQKFEGRLYSLMSWDQLTAFWGRLDPAGWYLYAVGEAVPVETATVEQTLEFIRRIDTLLRDEHRHDYCAIVYADDVEKPDFIKIYDPNNLGSACGVSGDPPLPGWIMSRVAPEDLRPPRPAPEGRRRWWRALFG